MGLDYLWRSGAVGVEERGGGGCRLPWLLGWLHDFALCWQILQPRFEALTPEGSNVARKPIG